MSEKLNFAIREGGKTVGAGVVTKILSNRQERSSIGRAPVSKTGGCGFESLRSCQKKIIMKNPLKFIQN